MLSVKNIRKHFIDELYDKSFVIDRNGMTTIELLGASFLATEPSIFGTPNQEYIDSEINWYDSQSTNINDIKEFEDHPKCWQQSANKHGEINSNYGHLIFSDKYHNQYGQVLDELIRNPDSRRACMVYNRPSIWMEYNENNKNDFICTNSVTYYIRDNILHAVVQMRSNDVVFGYKNDYAWQFEIMNRLVKDWNDCKFEEYDTGDKISLGSMIWQVQNLHVYERHFDLVK